MCRLGFMVSDLRVRFLGVRGMLIGVVWLLCNGLLYVICCIWQFYGMTNWIEFSYSSKWNLIVTHVYIYSKIFASYCTSSYSYETLCAQYTRYYMPMLLLVMLII